MAEYTIVPLDEAGFQIFSQWFSDAELRRRVQPPTLQWFDFVRSTPGCYAWLVHTDSGSAVGHVQLDTVQQFASIGLVVRPDVRNQGHGRRILAELLTRTETAQLTALEARIEPDNVASLRCFIAAGFVVEGSEPDDEGFLRLIHVGPASR